MKKRKPKPPRKEPRPHNYLSEYLDWYEKDGVIKYYEKLIEFKQQEIKELKQIVKDIAETMTLQRKEPINEDKGLDEQFENKFVSEQFAQDNFDTFSR